MKIGVVDYDAGNLRSVETALRYLGADFFISSRAEEILAADKIIFPGVGEARAAMDNLKKSSMDEALREAAGKGTPLLGICIGCQIILDHSEESDTDCLSLIPGKVIRFQGDFKIPHMGWNQVLPRNPHPLFAGIPDDTSFYFVHSYYPQADPEFVIAHTEYHVAFSSALQKENVLAVQFHPEKSGEYGLLLLNNFLKLGDLNHA